MKQRNSPPVPGAKKDKPPTKRKPVHGKTERENGLIDCQQDDFQILGLLDIWELPKDSKENTPKSPSPANKEGLFSYNGYEKIIENIKNWELFMTAMEPERRVARPTYHTNTAIMKKRGKVCLIGH